MASKWTSILCGTVLALMGAGAAQAGPNGFDVSQSLVPVSDIRRGGPARDGIPALDAPLMEEASVARWDDDTLVVGVVEIGSDGTQEARAYPLPILVWHELVNDRIGQRMILVSYCPLCGSAMVFDRTPSLAGQPRPKPTHFGVSGLLYLSDMLMFDRETGSLWSQIRGQAITGPRTGTRLSIVRSSHERWGTWRARYPETLVLSRKTGHRRDYGKWPYEGYDRSQRLYFPAPRDSRHHPKMRTLGLRTTDGTKSRAYPLETVQLAGDRIADSFAGERVHIAYSSEREGFIVDAPDSIEVIETFWFAWMAFHPNSSVYTQDPSDAGKEE